MLAAREGASSAAGIKGGGGGSARGNYNSWTKRLFEARRLRDAYENPMSHTRNLLLLHPATGLRKTQMPMCGEGRPKLDVWDAVVRRCRRQAHRAGRAMKLAMKAQLDA